MADGTTKAIEDVIVGDEVLATDPVLGETSVERVTDLITGDGLKDLVRVGSDPDGDGSVEWVTATATHPFWVRARGWTNAGDLVVGDNLLDHRGEAVQVTQISKSLLPAFVRNLTVNRIHTYFVMVGNSPVLAHNASCPVHGHGQKDGKASKGKHDRGNRRRIQDQQRSNNVNKRRPQCTHQPGCPK